MTADAVVGPAARRGADLAGRSDWVHQLTDTEIGELVEAVDVVRRGGRELTAFGPGDVVLPTRGPVIDGWADELEAGRGFVLVRGLPVGDLGDEDAATAYVVMGVRLAVPVSRNAAGELLGHVRDDGSDPDDPTVRRYRARLAQPFHVDGSDVVGLLCLHPAKRGRPVADRELDDGLQRGGAPASRSGAAAEPAVVLRPLRRGAAGRAAVVRHADRVWPA
ncbi:MAG TPA: TauD/TfdA family dioxygenase [Acidimicrobiales bacterium]|nr:TauD/TfdA family dioxygenase [Acidimicrobiales bacterium]